MKTKITVCSDIDYENLIAEIYLDGKFTGLLSKEPEQPLLFEVPQGKLNFESIPYDIFFNALEKAKKELLQE